MLSAPSFSCSRKYKKLSAIENGKEKKKRRKRLISLKKTLQSHDSKRMAIKSPMAIQSHNGYKESIVKMGIKPYFVI